MPNDNTIHNLLLQLQGLKEGNPRDDEIRSRIIAELRGLSKNSNSTLSDAEWFAKFSVAEKRMDCFADTDPTVIQARRVRTLQRLLDL